MNYIFSVCMSCGAPYGATPTTGSEGISHGYCTACAPAQIKAMKAYIKANTKRKAKK